MTTLQKVCDRFTKAIWGCTSVSQFRVPGLHLMALGLFYREVGILLSDDLSEAQKREEAKKALGDGWWGIVEKIEEQAPTLCSFSRTWADCGFPVVRTGHKLAAALALTDTEKLSVPFSAVAVQIPNKLLGNAAWFLIAGDETSYTAIIDDKGVSVVDMGVQRLVFQMVSNLMEALSNDAYVTKSEYRKGNVPKGKKNRGHRQPPMVGIQYEIKAPIEINFTKHVQDLVSGRTHVRNAPKVQYPVRGFWRNQPHGPGNTLRRRQWIPPFWKGPRDVAAVIRGHKING